MPKEPLPTQDQMLGFIIRFVQQGTHDASFEVLRRYQDDFVVLFGIMQRVRRFAKAYLKLAKEGYATEARLFVRGALEHAVTAQWVFYTVGGVDRLRVSAARDQFNLGRDTGGAQERLDELEAAVPIGKGMPEWAAIMREMDENRFIHQTYRVMSQIVHVTHSSIVDGLDIDEHGSISVRMEPEPALEIEVLYALTACCVLVAWLFAVMSGDAQEQRRVQERGVALHMPWRLDHHLAEERRRDAPPGL